MIKTIESLARGAVATAYSAARHPVTTAAATAGFVKGAAEASVGLVRTTISGHTPQPQAEESAPAPAATPSTPDHPDRPQPEVDVDPRDQIPGPDVVAAQVPTIDELPEPIVIRADDAFYPEQTQESFHHEPHATTRADTIGHQAGDVFEAEDEADDALEDLTEPRG